MKVLCCVSLAVLASAQLLPLQPKGYIHSSISDHQPQYAGNTQQPLASPDNVSDSKVPLPPFKAGNHSIYEQDGSACATKGERQWTGTIDISDERRLFYWFFESRNDPLNDSVIIWLNGGPGASSMRGLFTEVGPCMLEVGKNTTTINPYSWNNNASLLFIDQPAGVGFSDVKPGGNYAAGDVAAARDLQEFLRLFFSNIFPDKAHLPIHIAGESYGGHYVPVTLKYILDSREFGSKNAFWGNITSMILVNSVIHRPQSTMGHHELMCSDYRGKLWNKTMCQRLANGLPKVEEMNLACEMSADGRTCLAMEDLCFQLSLGILFDESEAGKRSVYNINKQCFNTPGCKDDTRGDFIEYLNQPEILETIGFPRDYQYEAASQGASQAIADTFDPFAPTTKQLASILDAPKTFTHRKDKDDIRLLVLNGNEDALCNTPGVKWVYDRLSWSGAAGYRARKWRDLTDIGINQELATGEWKNSKNGQLLLLGVDGAGHMMPMDKPEAADWIVRKWIARDI